MEEEGRWTKIFTIQQCVSEKHLLWGFWKGNAIFGQCLSGQMILHNLETQKISDIEPNSNEMIFWLTNYKNSLASVKHGLQNQEVHNSSVAFHEFLQIPPKVEENEHLRFTADLPNYPLDPPKCRCPYCCRAGGGGGGEEEEDDDEEV